MQQLIYFYHSLLQRVNVCSHLPINKVWNTFLHEKVDFFVFLSFRRSYSTDKSPGSSNAASPISQRKDINRSESLRVVSNRTHRIFRPSDLIHGEVLGKGCFGQAIKVDLSWQRLLRLISCMLHCKCSMQRVILKKSRRGKH